MADDAIAILKRDHEEVRELLSQLEETTPRASKRRPELLARIEHALGVHTRVEEEIFYPAFREAGDGEHDETFFEAREEHRAVSEMVLPDLLGTDPASDEFAGRAKVLKELVEHHAEEEEEEMFPRARKTLDQEQLEQLGQRIEERKRELDANR